MRTGRLAKTEHLFIEENANKLTAEQIALKLDRDLEPIMKYLHKIGMSSDNKANYQIQAEYDLKSKPYWAQLKKQFDQNELELLVYHWKQIIAQFKKDILPTEELQIVDTIKMEVLMNRALQEQAESKQKIRDFEEVIDNEKKKLPADQDRELIMALERQTALLMGAKEALSREYKDLQTKKSSLFKEIKGQRADRISSIESSKQSFSGLLEKIVKDPQFSEDMSLYMEKMRLAVDAERVRLGDFHEFGDNTVDRCLLSCDTVTEEG